MERESKRKKTTNRKKTSNRKTEESEEIQVEDIISLFKNRWVQFVIIIGISLFFRLYSLQYNYFVGADTALHYSIVRESIEQGGIPDLYTLSSFPEGELVTKPRGQYYLAILFGLQNFPIILPLIGIITITILFFLFGEFREEISLLAVLLLSFCLANVYRTQANLFRGDAIGALFLVSMIFLQLRMSRKRSYIYGFFIGILAGISSLFWIGYPVMLVIISATFLIVSLYQFFSNKEQELKTNLVSFLVFGLISKVIISLSEISNLLIQHAFTQQNYFMLFFVLPISLVNLLFYALLRMKANSKMKILTIIGIIVVLGMVLYLNIEAFTKIVTGYALVSGTYHINISELTSPNFQDLWDLFNLLIILFPVGLILYLKNYRKFKEKDYIILAWILVSMYLLFSSRRFLFHASFIVCFLSAYALIEIYKTSKRVRELKNISWLVPIVIGILLVSSFYLSYSKMEIFAPFFDEYWDDALLWLKQNSQPDEGILTYWDYGGFVQAYAERSSVTDSIYGQDVNRIRNLDSFLVNNTFFRSYGAKYLIVDKIMFYRLPWQTISYMRFDSIYNGLTTVEDLSTKVVRFTDIESGTVVEVYPDLAPNVGFSISGDTRIPFEKTVVQIEDNVYERLTYENVTALPGCFYYSFDIPLWVDDVFCESNYFKLAFGTGLEGLTPVYRNEEVTIYEVV